MTKRGATSRPGSRGALLAACLLAVLGLGGAITWWMNRQGARAERAFVLPGGRAVVVLRPVAILGGDHLARTIEVDVATGRALQVVDDEGTYGHSLLVHGPAGASLWYRGTATALWSRPLGAIATRVAHDLASHPELGAGVTPRWLTPDGLIVEGRAHNQYLLRPDGSIEPTDLVRNASRFAEWRADDERHLRVTTSARLPDGGQIEADALPLEGGGIVVAPGGAPLLLPVGAALAVGGDLRVPAGYAQVDRVGAIAPDRVLWSTSASALFDAPEHWDMRTEHLGIRVLAAGVEADAVTLVLRATDENGSSELRFVVLDAGTGRPRSRVGLAPLE